MKPPVPVTGVWLRKASGPNTVHPAGILNAPVDDLPEAAG